MVRNILRRRASAWAVSAIMACFGFTGLASAQIITNTGPDSTNTISSISTTDCKITNNNQLSVSNSNSQWAQSGDATVAGNTTAGLPWTGWNTLDPAVWQQNGQSYSAWQISLNQWLGQRADGAGWNTAAPNLTWTPGNPSSWSSWDPLLWQQNGQSFQNWYAQLNAHLASTAASLLSTWPAGATGNGLNLGGATSGNATNSNSTSFMLTITNGTAASPSMGGGTICGAYYQPGTPSAPGTPGTSGSPGSIGSVGSAGHVMGASIGGGGSGYGGGSYYPSSSFGGYNSPAAAYTAAASGVPSTPGTTAMSGAGGSGGGGQTPGTPSSGTISNTGPGSTNTISTNYTSNATVTNNNTVSVTTSNCQSAQSGDATVADNTTTGGGGSGSASNANDSGTGVTVKN